VGPVEMGIRPDDLHWITDAPSRCTEKVTGVITAIETTGAESFVAVEIEKQEVNTKFPSFADVRIGQQVSLVFDANDVHFFDAATGDSLRKVPSIVDGAVMENVR
jgi:multiple sugar transport system ATP-binding protein